MRCSPRNPDTGSARRFIHLRHIVVIQDVQDVAAKGACIDDLSFLPGFPSGSGGMVGIDEKLAELVLGVVRGGGALVDEAVQGIVVVLAEDKSQGRAKGVVFGDDLLEVLKGNAILQLCFIVGQPAPGIVVPNPAPVCIPPCGYSFTNNLPVAEFPPNSTW